MSALSSAVSALRQSTTTRHCRSILTEIGDSSPNCIVSQQKNNKIKSGTDANMDLENAEEILQILERYTKQKSKTIPDELNGYLSHVALTGDSVYNWAKVQYFYREKLAHVLKEFHDTTTRTEDLPVSRNVDAFNYDAMKSTLLERFDLFNAAPFTIQRLSELLNEPKKHYCRLDKFMRALEKNILVVSTVEPGHRQMGSENGDSINGDPLMDINVDIEMDKEPSSSCVPSATEKTATEAQPDSTMEETSTQIKTEQGTSEQCDELIIDDAKVNTNGHHTDELNDTIEDPKDDDDDIVDSTVKADDSSTSVEAITVEVQPAELAEKVNSPEEVGADVNTPISEASHVPSDIEQPKESTLSEAEQPLDGKVTTEAEVVESQVALKDDDTNEIIVEKKTESISESVKHSLDREGDDDCQPTAAKLVKIDESLTAVESVVVPEAEATEQVDVAKIDDVPSEAAVLDEQPTSEVKETLSETVSQEDSAPIQTSLADEQAVVIEPSVVSESTVADEQSIVASPSVDQSTAAIPADVEPVQPDTIDDTNNDTVSSETISPLASTLSNDLDILEEDEDELVEPIIADAEPIPSEPSTPTETDVEMMPSIDSAEQMAVEEPAPVLASTDSAMDATQIIPATSDEQMDVLENNSMDQDL